MFPLTVCDHPWTQARREYPPNLDDLPVVGVPVRSGAYQFGLRARGEFRGMLAVRPARLDGSLCPRADVSDGAALVVKLGG